MDVLMEHVKLRACLLSPDMCSHLFTCQTGVNIDSHLFVSIAGVCLLNIDSHQLFNRIIKAVCLFTYQYTIYNCVTNNGSFCLLNIDMINAFVYLPHAFSIYTQYVIVLQIISIRQ